MSPDHAYKAGISYALNTVKQAGAKEMPVEALIQSLSRARALLEQSALTAKKSTDAAVYSDVYRETRDARPPIHS